MSPSTRFVVACLAATWTLATLAFAAAAAEPTIRVVNGPEGRFAAFEATGIAEATLESLAKLPADDEAFSRLFCVRVIDGKAPADAPAMLGTYAVEGKVLRFTPRFPLRPGLRYRAVLQAGVAKDKQVTREVALPALSSKPAVVAHVYPSASKLPENQLRFYLHFSEPMSRGEAYEHIRLLGAGGRPIELPFLQIGEELWDASGKRLTLLIDPGRIKKGLKPREESGPVLEDGHVYTLVIDSGWHDATSKPLKASYKKRFSAGPPVETGLDTATWKIAVPAAGTTDSLVVRFPQPLDHALLERTLTVAGPKGTGIAGKATIADEEKRWEFRPDRTWSAGKHDLVVDTILEDLAGNRIGIPFEVDELRDIERTVRQETVRVPFEIVTTKPAGADPE